MVYGVGVALSHETLNVGFRLLILVDRLALSSLMLVLVREFSFCGLLGRSWSIESLFVASCWQDFHLSPPPLLAAPSVQSDLLMVAAVVIFMA